MSDAEILNQIRAIVSEALDFPGMVYPEEVLARIWHLLDDQRPST